MGPVHPSWRVSTKHVRQRVLERIFQTRKVSRIMQSRDGVTAWSLHTGHLQALLCGLFIVDMARGHLPPGVQLPAAHRLDTGVGRDGEGGGHHGS